MLDLILILMIVVSVVLLANVVEKRQDAGLTRLFLVGLGLFNLPLLLMGVTMLLIPADIAARLRFEVGLPLTNLAGSGLSLLAMGLWGGLSSLRGVRTGLNRRWSYFRPDSAVHALALVLSGYLIGNTLLTLTQGGLQEMASAAQEATIIEVVAQQAFFVLLAVTGVGLWVRRDMTLLTHRLGLTRLTWAQVKLSLLWIAVLVVVQWGFGVLAAVLDPAQTELLDSISNELFGGFDTVWEWFLLALAAGLGEELLFRGALQPVFGLWGTAVLFAVAHVQYGITPITLAVLVIGVTLGYVRERHSTTTAVFIHFGYNFVLGLFSLLAS